jgi:colanic acid/amylovoran biosynthesis glycosyltransferase
MRRVHMVEAASAPPTVMILAAKYPVASETFIRREITGLIRLGVKIVVATTDGDAPTHAETPGMIRAPAPGPFLVLQALKVFLQHPRSASRLLLAYVEQGVTALNPRELRWLFVSLWLLPRALRSAPALLHAHFASAPAVVARLLAAGLRVPWGLSVHAKDYYAARRPLAPLLGQASHIVACSEQLTADLRETLPTETAARVSVAHHGLNLQYWSPPSQRCSSDQLLAVGRFVEKKGFEVLARACAILALELGCKIHCRIVGEGPLREPLDDLIRRLGISSMVELLPWQSARGLRASYRAAALMVQPCTIASDGDRDNVPNTLLEAMACGTPCVVSNLPSISRLLGDSAGVVMVDAGDPRMLALAIRELLQSAADRQRLGAQGRRFVERHFNAELTLPRLRDVLQRSASAGTGSGPIEANGKA